MRGFQASIFILFILDATREEALGTLGSPETRHVKKAESAQLDFEGRGAQQIPSCLNMRTRCWGQMIGCFFCDSACCAHDLSAEASFPKVLQTFKRFIYQHSSIRSGQAHAAAVAGMDSLTSAKELLECCEKLRCRVLGRSWK